MESTFKNKENTIQTSQLRGVFLWIVLFGLEFDVCLYGPVSMRKLAFIAIIIYLLCSGMPRNPAIKPTYVFFSAGMVLLLIYAIMIETANTANIALPGNYSYGTQSIPQQFLFLFILPIMMVPVFKSTEEFCKTQMNVLVFQAVLAICSRCNSWLRLFIYHRFVPDADGRMLEGVESGVRVGFIGGIGAAASWILFAGCVFCLYFMLTKKREIKYLCYYFILLVAMVFVGRTGLYMGLALLFLYFVYSLTKAPRNFIRICILVMLAMFGIAAYIMFAPDSYLKVRTIEWVGEIFIKGAGAGSTVEVIRSMPIPALTSETFWGTGLVMGTTVFGTVIQNDVGYVQTYCALGLIGCILYYSTIYGFFTSIIVFLKNNKVKSLLLLFMIFIMIAECKEPFLRKTPVGMMLVTAALLQSRDEKARLSTLALPRYTNI